VYGAEVKTQGFSGYVCEVLTLKFNSFEEVLKHFAAIKRGEIVSVEPYDDALARSFSSPIVILDPVDTARNLGSAISAINLSKFILHSRSFLSKPSTGFFEENRRTNVKVSRSKELLERTVVLRFKTKQRSVDILWGQLYKSLDALSNKMELSGFEILRKRASSNEVSESALIYLLHETRISKFNRRNGPDVYRGEDLAKFMEKNRRKAVVSWLDPEGRAISLFERDRNSIDIFEQLKRMIRSPKELHSIGLSKGIAEEARLAKIVRGDSFLARKKDEEQWIREGILSLVRTEEELRHEASV
jgi:tRNA nucleotidyltransferase (CCA-adding enzyme)